MVTNRSEKASRGVAISGIVFALLYATSRLLLQLSLPTELTEPNRWFANPEARNWIGLALNLVPFSGLAFLWFMAAIRDHVGLKEDRLLSTVFLASGLLFVVMLFVASSIAQALLLTLGSESDFTANQKIYTFARSTAYMLMNVFGTRMSAVFMFVTSSIGLRTGVLPRWVVVVGFCSGIVLLLTLTPHAWVLFLFPGWVLLVSVRILIADFYPRASV